MLSLISNQYNMLLLLYVLFFCQIDDTHISSILIIVFFKINWHLSFTLIVINPPIYARIIIESMTMNREDDEERKRRREKKKNRRLRSSAGNLYNFFSSFSFSFFSCWASQSRLLHRFHFVIVKHTHACICFYRWHF